MQVHVCKEGGHLGKEEVSAEAIQPEMLGKPIIPTRALVPVLGCGLRVAGLRLNP